VKAVLDEFDGKINYETINQMPYLEAAIDENLRMYSPGVRYW
jgi:cytochrome P450